MAHNKIENLYIGQSYEKRFIVTEEIGRRFAEISGDYNPIHLDLEIAKTTRFKQKIVHGMLIGSYISGIIGNEFPGEGSVYIRQDVVFKRPVYYKQNIVVRVEVEEIDIKKKRVLLKTVCEDEHGELLVDGTALILLE